MKKFSFLIFLVGLLFLSCSKTSFTTSSNAYLLIPDSIKFDTIFTSIGSTTQSFKIFNPNKQSIHINEIKLSGGENSYFKMNVNGQSNYDFQNIDLAGGDSMYVFVAVNITPNDSTMPFLAGDSIGITYNSHQQFVQLQAYGQNAVFMKAQTINQDTTWTNHLPIVLLGNLTVATNTTLTIEKGTKIYAHAKTAFEVNGTLIANGGTDTADRILFTNDRFDYPYVESTNQWFGINFGADSKGNILNNVTVLNAYIGIADTMLNQPQTAVRLSLNGCILSNHDYAALYLRNANASIINSLITNSGAQVILENGGDYSFNYCTLVGYNNNFVPHGNPSLIIDNNPEIGATSALQATITNCIVYGDYTTEIETLEGALQNFSIDFNYGLYKVDSRLPLSGFTFSNSMQNTDPQFQEINGWANTYNFQLQATSPAIGTATPNATTTDILGQPRDAQHPTIGCYESRP